ncbi:trimeric intracellular cation channel family protein [Varibaculum prostatecancerukia]|uniref:trimeric intracellular cation channel family protein n=1 Tax=Varibaculum prostatecancerukia TaxID=2811781 RepID=UPI001C0068B2|nr:trimeric intracellular cation channel family protein [Varibaculum prostatecancerukia]
MPTSSLAPEVIEIWFRAVDVTGVFCAAVIGAKLARERRFDAVGFATLAVISALGGGMTRDVLLQQIPVAFTDPFYLGGALLGATVAFFWRLESKWTNRMITVADALCLGCWAATGAQKTLALGLGVLPAMMMGLTTAVGGSIIRDVMVGKIPKIFGGANLYATPAATSAVIMVVFFKLNMPVLGMALSIIAALIFVLLAQWRGWVLPEALDLSINLTPRQFRQLLRLRDTKPQDSKDTNPVTKDKNTSGSD